MMARVRITRAITRRRERYLLLDEPLPPPLFPDHLPHERPDEKNSKPRLDYLCVPCAFEDHVITSFSR